MTVTLRNNVSATNSFPNGKEIARLKLLISKPFEYTSEQEVEEVDIDLLTDETKLSQLCVEMSEPSLAKDWENEDSAHWQKFLDE